MSQEPPAVAERADRPLAQSGIPLAGANKCLSDSKSEDGVLYGLGPGLDLDGTELAVLSA